METADAKLAKRCINGDSRAWESVVESLNRKVYNMAYRYTGRFDLAEELTQDVFLKVYQNLDSYRPQAGPLRNWVMRVGRNLLIDNYRARKYDRKVAGSDELEAIDFKAESGLPNPFQNLYVKEKAEFLMGGLDQLTPELREAVVLRDLQEMTYQEMADLLEIPLGTVKSRINRGRVELAKVLTDLRRQDKGVEA